MTDDVISALLRALELSPDDAVLRLHVAELLVAGGRGSEAIGHLGTLLAADPGHARALELMASALSGPSPREVVAPHEPAYDWAAAEEEVGGIVAPAFVEATSSTDDEPAAYAEVPRLRVCCTGR